jgi:hypothetical protein
MIAPQSPLATGQTEKIRERDMYRLFGLVALLVVGNAWGQDAFVDFDKSVDFESYKTFVWVNSDEDLSEISPLWHERIRNGIIERLVEGGMTELGREEAPDVYVTYFASTAQKTRVVTDHMGYGYGSSYHRRGGGMAMGMGTSTSRVITYDKGTLVIDIWDAERKEMVWRGSTTDTMTDNPQKMEKRLVKMLDKLVKVWNREYRKANK